MSEHATSSRDKTECVAPNARDDARHRSPWTMREKIGRALWYTTRATLFRHSPRRAYRWRRMLLRLFGASVARTAHVHATALIEIPWNLSVGDNSAIGERAIIYNLGPITIGKRVTISQYAHLCAGTHDYTRNDMPLIRPPVTIGDDAWIAADAFVGPGVTVSEGAIVGARASAFKDIPPWKIVGGNPAKPIKDRDPVR